MSSDLSVHGWGVPFFFFFFLKLRILSTSILYRTWFSLVRYYYCTVRRESSNVSALVGLPESVQLSSLWTSQCPLLHQAESSTHLHGNLSLSLPICPSFPAKISSPFQVSLPPFLSSPAPLSSALFLNSCGTQGCTGVQNHLGLHPGSACAALNKLIKSLESLKKTGSFWWGFWMILTEYLVEVLCKGLHVLYTFKPFWKVWSFHMISYVQTFEWWSFEWSAAFKHFFFLWPAVRGIF